MKNHGFLFIKGEKTHFVIIFLTLFEKVVVTRSLSFDLLYL